VNQLLVVDSLQDIPIEYTEIIKARTHNHDLCILEQPSSSSTSQIRPSWPRCRLRLSLLLVSLPKHASCYHAQPSILLFIPMGRVSHLMPSLLSGWLLTNVQVNNLITLHDTHGHTYIHHIGITILLFFLHFFYSPWQAGWFRPFPSDTIALSWICKLYNVFLHYFPIPAV
jgi:hypothetical protein